MPLLIRRILTLTAVFSLSFTAALLIIGTDSILPAIRPISLVPLSQTFASINLFGQIYTLDLTIIGEVLSHLRRAADIALVLLPRSLR